MDSRGIALLTSSLPAAHHPLDEQRVDFLGRRQE